MKNYLAPVIIEPKSEHKSCVIWLHGLGADGHDFEPIVPHLGVDDLGIKFIFPQALSQPVTINGGMVMPSWYDIVGVQIENRADAKGIQQSVAYVNYLIDLELKSGIEAKNIVLAGFSQGGVVCLHAGLKYSKKLAGFMALSTYLPLVESLQNELHDSNKTTPIFHAHGSMDPVVPVDLAEQLFSQLKMWDYSIESYRYPMQHAVCPEEISQIGIWLRKTLPS